MTHTPGPWRIDGAELIALDSADSPARYSVIRSPEERWTALVEIEDTEGEANARLIASAPELLATIETIHANAAESVEWIRRHTSAAIARAKGNP